MEFVHTTHYTVTKLHGDCFGRCKPSSLLRFAQDQLDKGRGIARYSDPDFYTDVLGFVKLYGVSTYGCRITTTPSVLLELLESGVINYTLVLDTFIP